MNTTSKCQTPKSQPGRSRTTNDETRKSEIPNPNDLRISSFGFRIFFELRVSAFVISCLWCLELAQAAQLKFKPVEIDSKIEIGYGIAAADVNGDKKTDLVLADKNQIVWYENPSWKKHVIAEKLTPRDHVCLAAADIDGDGKAEIAAGAEWNPGDTVNSGAVFYLIPPADRTQKWEPVKLHHEPTVHRMRWVRNAEGKFDLVVVPLHGRGNNPKAEGAGVKILAYKVPSDPTQPWKTESLDESLHKTHNFDPVQLDRDAAEEMFVVGKEGLFLLDATDRKVTLLGTNSIGGAGEVRAGRIAGKVFFVTTVEPMHGNTLALYTAPSAIEHADATWHRLVLDESLIDGHALACGDLIGQGRDQIVVGWRAMNRPGAKVGVKVFISTDKEGRKWTATTVDDGGMACEDLVLADLNGDAKLDIAAAGRATKNVKIYFNESQH